MSEYVKFLVRDLDSKILLRIQRDAYRRRRSTSDWMRALLCRHYELDCPSSRASARKGVAATTFVLRMTPDLHQAVIADASESGRSMQVCVREALEAPYRKKKLAA